MNLAKFRTMYPEFTSVRDEVFIQAFLDEAANALSPAACGTRFDELHGLLTAHKLVMSPHGKQMRMQPATPGATSVYWPRYQQVVAETTCGAGLAGGALPFLACDPTGYGDR